MKDTAPAALCGLCCALFEQIIDQEINKKRRGYTPFHQDREALHDSLNSGCLLCSALDYDIRTFIADEVLCLTEYDDHVSLYFKVIPAEALRFTPAGVNRSYNECILTLFKADKYGGSFDFDRNSYSTPNTGDPRTLDQVNCG